MKYKNISQRARRYARSKRHNADGFALSNHERNRDAKCFADGYRFAMKEIRRLFHTFDAESEKPLVSEQAALRVWDFANDTERLK